MKILITGASGFVGCALSRFLTEQGHEIIRLDHDVHRSIMEGLSSEFVLVFGDVRDFKRMREILYNYRPDAIIHLAAQAIVQNACINPISTYETNVLGTINLLETWKEAAPNAYFLYFSTDKVYGDGLDKKESDPVKASGPYESSKAAADLIAQAYGATVTRAVNIYGPGDRNLRIIPNTIQTCLRGENPSVYEDAGQREYIYIDDLCTIVHELLVKRARGIWNISSGLCLTNQQVIAEILKHFPNLKTTPSKSPITELKDQSLNTEKLCANMDCLSFTTFPAGIAKTVGWWRNESA